MTADLTGAPTCDDRLGSKDETASQELVQSALRSSVAENLKGTWWLPTASGYVPNKVLTRPSGSRGYVCGERTEAQLGRRDIVALPGTPSFR